jgi:hypothetical protein
MTGGAGQIGSHHHTSQRWTTAKADSSTTLTGGGKVNPFTIFRVRRVINFG